MPEAGSCCMGYLNPMIAEECESFEEIMLPKTYWTKARMLKAAEIGGLNSDALEKMELMKLEDLKSIFLIKKAIIKTGSEKDPAKQRHTAMYALDWNFISHYYGVDCQ